MEQLFINDQVAVEGLPRTKDLVLIPLEQDYLIVTMIGVGIFDTIMSLAAVVFFFATAGSEVPEFVRYMVPGILLSIVLLSIILAYKGFYYKAYALRQKDIIYKSGYIWRTQTAVPFNRVQHCEVNHGPIDRMFGLTSLKIFTAGGSSSDMTIPGLKPEIANDLKHFITKQSAIVEEE